MLNKAKLKTELSLIYENKSQGGPRVFVDASTLKKRRQSVVWTSWEASVSKGLSIMSWVCAAHSLLSASQSHV
ncbi:hypothetical protein J4Q44_G00392420 [Coregonus suidteri]|uniref:Uncharacterized protein n=1 Tax=Coregonus suidteri TaxID=861788 RepID=A0AAN8Q408_9TELE